MQDLDFAEFKTVDSIGDVDGEEGMNVNGPHQMRSEVN